MSNEVALNQLRALRRRFDEAATRYPNFFPTLLYPLIEDETAQDGLKRVGPPGLCWDGDGADGKAEDLHEFDELASQTIRLVWQLLPKCDRLRNRPRGAEWLHNVFHNMNAMSRIERLYYDVPPSYLDGSRPSSWWGERVISHVNSFRLSALFLDILDPPPGMVPVFKW